MVSLPRYRRGRHPDAWSALLALVLLIPLAAGAEVQRLAILVGVNRGLEDEKPLRYAARDAREMATLLRSSGAFDKDRIYLHADESLERIKATLGEVAGRVKELKKGGAETLVLFFYSGHGSAGALHIQGRKYPRDEIAQYISALGSDLKIVILDACESGDFLRQKGGRLLESEGVSLEDSLRSRGTIFLSSSSSGEMSQESEEYRGAVFSHHLMNGMRGLADYDRDRSVTLMEAFDYARETTRMEKISGRERVQNPAFDFDLVGETDPVLTRIPSGRARLTLTGMPWAPLEIYESGSLALAYRVWLTGKDSLTYMIPAGKYVLCLQEKGVILTRNVDLSWDGEVVADKGHFTKRPKSTWYEKGSRALLWNPHGLRMGLSRTEAIPGLSVSMVTAGYEFRGYRVQHGFDLGYGLGTLVGLEFDNAVQVIRAGYGIKSAFLRWRLGQATLGLEAAWDYALQEVTDKRFKTPIDGDAGPLPLRREFGAHLWRLSAPLENELHLPGGLWISAGASGGAYSFLSHSEGKQAFRLEWGPKLGLGYRF